MTRPEIDAVRQIQSNKAVFLGRSSLRVTKFLVKIQETEMVAVYDKNRKAIITVYPMSRLVKYPKTPHLPWSPGLQNDDRLIDPAAMDKLMSEEVVVTEKMDGENTTMYRDAIHARSLDGRHHASRNWVKALHGQIAHMIPEGVRFCGENLYATHSIHYTDLPTYFMVFSIWNGERCLSWDETEDVCRLFGLQTVPVIYRGPFDRWDYRQMALRADQEGYVVRVARSFTLGSFDRSVAKYVRRDHIQTDQHWMAKPVVPNGLLDR